MENEKPSEEISVGQERLHWQVACRDDEKVAQALYAGEPIEEIHHLNKTNSMSPMPGAKLHRREGAYLHRGKRAPVRGLSRLYAFLRRRRKSSIRNASAIPAVASTMVPT